MVHVVEGDGLGIVLDYCAVNGGSLEQNSVYRLQQATFNTRKTLNKLIVRRISEKRKKAEVMKTEQKDAARGLKGPHRKRTSPCNT